jgi:hypothetical protein
MESVKTILDKAGQVAGGNYLLQQKVSVECGTCKKTITHDFGRKITEKEAIDKIDEILNEHIATEHPERHYTTTPFLRP